MININEIDKILNKLLASTDTSLRSVQLARCPHYIDLNLERIPSKKYIHMDNKLKSIHEIIKINNIESIKLDRMIPSYKGPIKYLIDNNLIKPIILFINNEMIELDNINIITDKRNHYLEVKKFGNINYSIGGKTSKELNGNIEIQLPKVPDQLKQYMRLNIATSTPTKISNIRLNGNMINLDNINNLESLLNSNTSNKLDFICDKAILSKIEFYNTDISKIPIIDLKCIMFPDGIQIKNIPVTSINTVDNKDFIFFNGMQYTKDSFSKIPLECSATVIKPIIKFTEDINFYYGINTLNKYIELPLDNEHKVYQETMFIFNRGYSISSKSYGVNTFECDYDTFNYKVFYYKKNISNDNITRYSKIANMIELILNNNLSSHVNMIKDPLDFLFNSQVPTKERILDLVKVICEYNSYLLQDYINSKSNIELKQYTGDRIKELSNNIDTNKYLYKIMRKIDRKYNSSLIIFKNGLLYDMNNIEYDHMYININFENISDDDIFDFMIFKRTNNDIIPIKIDSNNKQYLVSNYIPFNDLKVLTHDIDYHIYNHIPVTENLQYELEYKLKDLGKGYVEFDLNDYYYNRDLTLCSKRQFIHEKYVITGNEMLINGLYKILLPDTFRYCTNRHQFLLFHNSRKIDSDDGVICLNRYNLPFDKRFIHLTKRCEIGDIIDIIYIPQEMREVYTIDFIDNRGYIEIDKSKLGYNFEGTNSSIFINGKRVSQDKIISVSTRKIRVLKDTNSIANISVLRHIDYSDDIFEIIGSINSIWDEMVSSLTNTELDELFKFNIMLSNTENNMRDNSFLKREVLYEIVRRYWLVHDNKIKVENPIFNIYEHEGVYCFPINSSNIESLDILGIYRNNCFEENIVEYGGVKALVLDANEEVLNYNDLDIPIYQDYTHNNILIAGDDNPVIESVINLILDNGNISDIVNYGGRDSFPIDAGKEYLIMYHNEGIGSYNEINAAIIRPYFFNNLITVKSNVPNIYPIPIDSSMNQIHKLPDLIDENL